METHRSRLTRMSIRDGWEESSDTDSDSGTSGTLRAAINQANAAGDPNTILFGVTGRFTTTHRVNYGGRT